MALVFMLKLCSLMSARLDSNVVQLRERLDRRSWAGTTRKPTASKVRASDRQYNFKIGKQDDPVKIFHETEDLLVS